MKEKKKLPNMQLNILHYATNRPQSNNQLRLCYMCNGEGSSKIDDTDVCSVYRIACCLCNGNGYVPIPGKHIGS